MNLFMKFLSFVMNILETITFVGSLFIVVYLFIMGPNQVKGASMEPTFQTGDYILTSKITYKFRPIQRGDVVVFRSLKNPDIEFIKRVIGLPGDQILLRDQTVYVNSQPIQEDYIADKTNPFPGGFLEENIPVVVPAGNIFAMGDNRPHSSDSREFGPVPMENIIGVVFYRYFPAKKVGQIVNPLLRK